MFANAATACCANNKSSAAAGAKLPASMRRHSGRTVPFPMVDPFVPVTATGAPITAITTRRRGRSYYGLNGLGFGEPGLGEDTVWEQGVRLPSSSGSTLERIFAGIRSILPGIPAVISAATQNPYYNPQQAVVYTTQQGQQVRGTIDTRTGAVTDVGAQTGAALGNLGDTFGRIVAEHPYLTLGVGAATVLWFMNPPRRR